jgi:glycyl-tRNA synthetase alpha subunit
LALYGKEYLDKYIKNVENFVEFFMNWKNRKNKKTNEIKSINIPLESESTENTYNNELINKESDKTSRKFSSIAIQTDISDINAKIIVFS